MEIIKEFNVFKNLIDKGGNLFKDKYHKKVVWKTYEYKGIKVSKDVSIDKNYNQVVDDILPALDKWKLIDNSIEFYTTYDYSGSNYGKFIKKIICRFRLSDIVSTSKERNHTEMPPDIRDGMINDLKSCLQNNYQIEAEDMPERGYIYFNIDISKYN